MNLACTGPFMHGKPNGVQYLEYGVHAVGWQGLQEIGC